MGQGFVSRGMNYEDYSLKEPTTTLQRQERIKDNCRPPQHFTDETLKWDNDDDNGDDDDDDDDDNDNLLLRNV